MNGYVKHGFVYIMANRVNGTIYTGVTSELIQRVSQYRQSMSPGFARKYDCKLLVWFEAHDDLQEARLRELQIKKWKRQWKLELIEKNNPDWLDLYSTLL